MLTDVLLGGGIGVLIALLLSVPALIAEFRRRHEGHPLLLDVHYLGNRELNDRETFALGLLLHLLLGLFFGLLYPLNPIIWEFAGDAYSLGSLAAYGCALYLVASLIVLPLMGAGWFGAKADKWSWFELFVALVLLVLGFYVSVQWFQPSWFLV